MVKLSDKCLNMYIKKFTVEKEPAFSVKSTLSRS